MDLELKVEGKGGKIEIGKEYLTKIQLKFDSPNDDVTDRSSKAILKAEIDGIISNDVKTQTVDLLKWALTKKEDVYRKVTIQIEDTDAIIREYIFSKAFVIDYTEKLTNVEENTFKLLFAQKGDKLDEVEVSDK